MQKQIELGGKTISYRLKRSKRAKRMRIAIYRDCSMVVTAPNWLEVDMVEQFIFRKAGWVFGKLEHFKKFSGVFVKQDPRGLAKHKEQALRLAKSRIDFFNQHYCFKFNRISIRSQKTRWGSCSKTGNLNFNYKIALLPERAADYIIVHELCHLGEFNHSKKFWALVAQTIPDYDKIKRELYG